MSCIWSATWWYDRRFAGVAKIYGDVPFHIMNRMMVIRNWWCWVRGQSGFSAYRRWQLITLVDMDSIAASNINRQLPMSSTLDHEKIEVMAERCRSINPRIKINLIDDYLTPRKRQRNFRTSDNFDCIDDVKAKLALMLHCRFNKIPLIVQGRVVNSIHWKSEWLICLKPNKIQCW